MTLLTKLAMMAGLMSTSAQQSLDQDNETKSLLTNRVSGYKLPLTNKQQKARNKNKRAAKVRHKL